MLIKQEQYIDENKINGILNRLGTSSFNINTQLIQSDIDKVKDKTYNSKEVGFKAKEKYKAESIDYLNRLLSITNRGRLNITWQSVANKITSSPIELHRITEFKVLMTDYIVIQENEKMVYFDFTDVVKIIAFSIMYNDFDETFESIEEKLKDIGIVTDYNAEEILKYIPEDIIELSKQYRISDSPNIDETGKKIFSYFNDKQFKADKYKEVCEHSYNYCIEVILMHVISELMKESIRFKICSVFDTGFYILISEEKEFDINKVLNSGVSIRAFGRKFSVKNKIRIY